MKQIFKPKHSGQKVTSNTHGLGVILEVVDSLVLVAFENNTKVEKFTQDGRYSKNDYLPTLVFGWLPVNNFSHRIPKDNYKPLNLEKEKTAWCYVGDSIDEVLQKEYKELVIASTIYSYLSINNGYSNTQSTTTVFYKYAMRCEDLD